MTPAPAVIFGCGYLGSRVAARWVAAGRTVVAVTRGRAGELAATGLKPVVADVTDRAALAAVPRASTLLYAVGLDRRAGHSMRGVTVDGLRAVLETVPPPERLLYISSTSVFGQTSGEWVDETSPTDPVEESGKVALDAERVLRELCPSAVVLRFAGLYGPGRVLRKAALLAGEPLVGDAEKWLNLIHVEDGADAVLAAEAKAASGSTYLISDGIPVTRRAFYTRSAEQLGGPPAAFEHRPEPGQPNRRVSNAKAVAELGSFSPRLVGGAG